MKYVFYVLVPKVNLSLHYLVLLMDNINKYHYLVMT